MRISWLDSLPSPTTAFTLKTSPSVVRTSMASGRIRQRRQAYQQYTQAAVQWSFTAEEYALFRAWHYHLLANGAGWFTIQLPHKKTLSPQTARFVNGQYQASYQDWWGWSVSATLDVKDIPLMKEALIYWWYITQDPHSYISSHQWFDALDNTLHKNHFATKENRP